MQNVNLRYSEMLSLERYRLTSIEQLRVFFKNVYFTNLYPSIFRSMLLLFTSAKSLDYNTYPMLFHLLLQPLASSNKTGPSGPKKTNPLEKKDEIDVEEIDIEDVYETPETRSKRTEDVNPKVESKRKVNEVAPKAPESVESSDKRKARQIMEYFNAEFAKLRKELISEIKAVNLKVDRLSETRSAQIETEVDKDIDITPSEIKPSKIESSLPELSKDKLVDNQDPKIETKSNTDTSNIQSVEPKVLSLEEVKGKTNTLPFSSEYGAVFKALCDNLKSAKDNLFGVTAPEGSKPEDIRSFKSFKSKLKNIFFELNSLFKLDPTLYSSVSVSVHKLLGQLTQLLNSPAAK